LQHSSLKFINYQLTYSKNHSLNVLSTHATINSIYNFVIVFRNNNEMYNITINVLCGFCCFPSFILILFCKLWIQICFYAILVLSNNNKIWLKSYKAYIWDKFFLFFFFFLRGPITHLEYKVSFGQLEVFREKSLLVWIIGEQNFVYWFSLSFAVESS
jgi:hypothetical protein